MRSNTLAFCLMTAFAGSLVSAQEAASHQPVSQGGHGSVIWTNVLKQYTQRFGLYFTLEQDDFYDQSRGVYVDAPPEPKTADEVLDLLRKWLPDCTVMRDALIPNLVHIRDKPPEKADKIILDEKVSLTFNGTSKDLFLRLNQMTHGSLIVGGGGGGSGGVRIYDVRLPTRVDVKDGTYRDILDLAILYGDWPILWTARYYQRSGKGAQITPGVGGRAAALTQPAATPASMPAPSPGTQP